MKVTYSIRGCEIGYPELSGKMLVSEEITAVCNAVRRRMRRSAA